MRSAEEPMVARQGAHVQTVALAPEPRESRWSHEVARLLLDPNRLMRPERLAALAPSRLSASRSLVNRMLAERWSIELVSLDVDERARGTAIYRVRAGSWTFSFVAYSFEPVLEGRTGRIIGSNWDMAGSLVEGEINPEDVETTRSELPKLYAGRSTPGTLVWCRSNRSLRLFEYVCGELAAGQQPNVDELWNVGYLMRNTGLDGNGTFGTRSFLALEDDHPLGVPYHAQMLAAYLMREFSFDLLERMAQHANPDAVKLEPELKRCLGLGNGSALGLVFFINTHPVLIERWLRLRQHSIALAAELPLGGPFGFCERLDLLLEHAARFYAEDPFRYTVFRDPTEIARDLRVARAELESLTDRRDDGTVVGDLLVRLESRVCIEAWEVAAALLLELDPAIADAQTPHLAVDESLVRNPGASVGELRQQLESEYGWATGIEMDAEGARAYLWYKSRDAEEPRRGVAEEVPGGRNWALDLPGDIQRLQRELAFAPSHQTVGEFLASRPGLRGIVERVQSLAGSRYHSPHMNMLDAQLHPVHLVRFMNAAFHGLDRTVDSLDRNVLGLLFQGAPTREELATTTSDYIYASKPEAPRAEPADADAEGGQA